MAVVLVKKKIGAMEMAQFKQLWDSFPEKSDVQKKCFNKQPDSEKPFDDYCAILLSECFIKAGININTSTGKKCWSHLGSGARHLLLAEDFANWLSKSPPSGFGKAEKITPSNFQSQLSGRTGIVFFKDYWTRGKESFQNRSGDHIDLWNKNRITGGSMLYRSIIELFGLVSDLNKSRQVLFWEVS